MLAGVHRIMPVLLETGTAHSKYLQTDYWYHPRTCMSNIYNACMGLLCVTVSYSNPTQCTHHLHVVSPRTPGREEGKGAEGGGGGTYMTNILGGPAVLTPPPFFFHTPLPAIHSLGPMARSTCCCRIFQHFWVYFPHTAHRIQLAVGDMTRSGWQPTI